MLIVQHRREQFHRFNTARIVRKALQNSHLVADYTVNLADRLRLMPRAGVLYPARSAQLISDIPTEQRPEQLVVLDGTWDQARTLIRQIPALDSLPRYCLAPSEPSRYRIRREPNATSLSTVEAAVAALRILEPETTGLDLLLKAFDTMVEGQLCHSGTPHSERRYKHRNHRTYRNIPRALLGNLENIVVAYGEAPAGERGSKRIDDLPISWVAQRLGPQHLDSQPLDPGETFACLLTPLRPLEDGFLNHLALSRDDFSAALTLTEARRRWAEFLRPDDIVTFLRPGTARLYASFTEGRGTYLLLKGVNLEAKPDPLTLESDAVLPEFHSNPVMNGSRAARRLAESVALVRHLHRLGNLQLCARAASSKAVTPWGGYVDEWQTLRLTPRNSDVCPE